VEARTTELVRAFARSLERRGISLESYLTITGTQPDELRTQMRTEAERAVARELVLEAVADELGLEVSDADVEAFVAEHVDVGEAPEQALERLRESGGFESIREDLRLKAALDRVAGEVQRIPESVAEARDRLWTPGQEKTPADTKLWTPGSKEP
jgi:trigger factor